MLFCLCVLLQYWRKDLEAHCSYFNPRTEKVLNSARVFGRNYEETKKGKNQNGGVEKYSHFIKKGLGAIVYCDVEEQNVYNLFVVSLHSLCLISNTEICKF